MPRTAKAAASQPTSPAGEWAEWYLQRVVGGHGPGPLHSRGLGAVQQLEGIFHCGEGARRKGQDEHRTAWRGPSSMKHTRLGAGPACFPPLRPSPEVLRRTS